MDAGLIERAADAVRRATALLVTAGAGMGVDSGLPDFRGDEGFWRAYPPFRKLGLSFVDLANPGSFRTDPELAWGFYGHRLLLYRATRPHDGFAVLKKWTARAAHGGFVFTSNVDGAFQRAGFDPARVFECHGALDFAQCTKSDCRQEPFSADAFAPVVDPETFRDSPPLPACPRCGALARPNLLMFGDASWDSARYDAQRERMNDWLARVRATSGARIVVVECGAGTAIPTVRQLGERVARMTEATLVRINVREPEVPRGQIGIAAGALAALTAIDALLG